MRISKLIQGNTGTPSPLLPPASKRVSSSAAAIQFPVLDPAFRPRREGLIGYSLGNRYLVRALLGRRGAGGGVYRAFDQHLGREVAIRVQSGTTHSSGGISFLQGRLGREARMAAGIRHPHVVTIFDHGSDPDAGVDYLVMELLEGDTMGRLIRKLGLPRLGNSIRFLRQAAAGLAAGHRAGLVHRAVKPDNLFLEASGPEVRLKVLDFGSPGTSDLPLAEDHVTFPARSGSFSFASPEQLRGEYPITPSSDVFSLGAVAHHLVTGSHLCETMDPNRALREMETSRDNLLQDRGVPLKLREVVGRALASHPADRFRDAREMLIALDGVHVGSSGEIAAVETAEEDIPEVIAVRIPHDPAPAALDPRAVPPSVSALDREFAVHLDRYGLPFVAVMVGSICFLTIAAGEWHTIVAALSILVAAAIRPLPGENESGKGPARFLVVTIATLVLLGIMVSRAMAGSIPDLLAAQMIISRLLLWANGAPADGAPGRAGVA